jgi:hypothetical protein
MKPVCRRKGKPEVRKKSRVNKDQLEDKIASKCSA